MNLTYDILSIANNPEFWNSQGVKKDRTHELHFDEDNFVIGKLDNDVEFKILIGKSATTEVTPSSIQGSPFASSTTSTPSTYANEQSLQPFKVNLELFYDDDDSWSFGTSSQGDYYNFFDKIKRGLFSEFKDILHEDGLIKGLRVGTQTNYERMKKFYYLFHVVLSKEQPVTCLQYACMWSRIDFVVLILQYLVGASPEFAKIYINYAANFDVDANPAWGIKVTPRTTKEHFYYYTNNKEFKTAYDLVAWCAKDSWGIVSGLSQLGSIASNIPKALESGRAIYGKIIGKAAKSVGSAFTMSNRDIAIKNVLTLFGGMEIPKINVTVGELSKSSFWSSPLAMNPGFQLSLSQAKNPEKFLGVPVDIAEVVDA